MFDHWLHILAGLTLSLAIGAAPVMAARPATQVAVPVIVYQQIQTPVEQQTVGGATQPDCHLWVVNPTERPNWNSTDCTFTPHPPGWSASIYPWDADDQVMYQVDNAVIAPGASIVIDQVTFADWRDHLWTISSSVTGLTLILSIPELGWMKSGSQQQICAVGPDYDRDSTLLQPIAGSGGGMAVPLTLRLEAKNNTNKTIRKVGLLARVVPDVTTFEDVFCPAGAWINNPGGWESEYIGGPPIEYPYIRWSR